MTDQGLDTELRRQVEALLKQDDAAADPLAEALVALAPTPAGAIDMASDGGHQEGTPGESADLPRPMGPYRLLEKIGQGGLAAVYLAERADGQFHRRVAVKVVRRELVSPRLLEDLKRERQILARLEHPCIARLYDGGTGPAGEPFLAMELIEGQPIGRFCAALPLRRRLEIFLDVCSAVSFAHSRLVIHQDIKDSNILITEAGTAKLLDFGIARSVEAAKSDDSGSGVDDGPRATGTLHEPAPTTSQATSPRFFTPDYASPEQIAGATLTTATDIYSLGVVLYRLITGRAPYRLPAGPTSDLIGALDAQPRIPPSRAAKTPLPRQAQADLDAIVTKAMARRPDARYGSVSELADDLRNHLERRPVLARPGSWSYRARRFLRRHRLAVGASALVLLTLISGLLATALSLRQAHEARRQAEEHLAELSRERQRAEHLMGSCEAMFQLADPGETAGETITVREMIDLSTEHLTFQKADPELGARLALSFGRIYLIVASPRKAQKILERAIELADSHLGSAHRPYWTARSLWAEALIDQGEFTLAADFLDQQIRRHRRLRVEDPVTFASLLHTRGVAHLELGQPQNAAALFRHAIRLYQGSETRDLAVSDGIVESQHRLAQASIGLSELSEAEILLEGVVQYRRSRHGDDYPSTLTALGDLAAVALNRNEDERAAELFRSVLERQGRVFGREHPHIAVALQNLAVAERRLGHHERARELLEEAIEIRRHVHGEEHVTVAEALYALARVYHGERHLDEAERAYRRVLEIRREALGEDHAEVAMAWLGLADIAWSRQELERAEPLYRDVIRRLDAAGQGETYNATLPAFRLGRLLRRTGRPAEALEWLARARDLRRRLFGAEHASTQAAQAELEKCRGLIPDHQESNDPAPSTPN